MIRKTLYLFGRSRRRRWIIVILLAVLGSLLEAVGAALVLILLSLIVDPGTAVTLPILGELPRVADNTTRETTMLVAGIAAFFMIRGGVKLLEAYVQQRVVHQAGVRLSVQLLQGYLAMPYAWHLQHNSASLIRNIHAAVSTIVNKVFLPSIRIVAETLLLLALLTVLFVTSLTGTLLALAVLGPIVVVLILVVQPALKRFGRIAHETVGRYFSTLQQSLTGIRDVKVFGRQRFFTSRFLTDRAENARAGYLQGTLIEVPRVLIETSLLLVILAFLLLALRRGETAASILPILGLFAYAGLRMQPSLQKIAAGINSLRFATAAIDEVYAGLHELEAADALRPAARPEPLPFEHHILLQGVSYWYENSRKPALSDVDIVIAKGETIGVCGPTGGGKTTLVDLIAGLLEPTEGLVSVDGEDISMRSSAWQRNLGMVPQSVFLVDDTLRRNVALGVPDDKIEESAVFEAVDSAQLTDFVATLPDGLDTTVGERGVRLSGGQRQRVAIARALYNRPSVIIFDEGTSALDNITEAELIKTLDRIRAERTIIVVAHRLTTVRNCDRIALVADGRIVDVGSHSELLARSHEFRQLVELA